MQDTPHYLGHRKRLRERFRRTGFDGFQSYEALELLLTYAAPRRDVKPLAKSLINTFGSLRNVLDATFDDLTQKGGLSEHAATFILALKGASSLYLREAALKRKVVSDPVALLEYCSVAMSGLKDEQFRVIFLNSENEVLNDEVIGMGTVNETAVQPRKILERALYHKATALILVHNHPAGSIRPSDNDRVLTAEIVKAARSLGIRVHDHLIVGPRGHFSFSANGLM